MGCKKGDSSLHQVKIAETRLPELGRDRVFVEIDVIDVIVYSVSNGQSLYIPLPDLRSEKSSP